MSATEARAIYDAMLENGELSDMLPGSTGEWETDRNKFMKIYQDNLDMLSFDINFDDDITEL